MTEVASFSQAWNAYVAQYGNPPKDANQLQKYSKANKEIADITYPIARLQFAFNSKVLNAKSKDLVGDTNDISIELDRLKKQLTSIHAFSYSDKLFACVLSKRCGGKYGKLWDREFFEFGKIHNDKQKLTILQFNVTLDKMIFKQKDEEKDAASLTANDWKYRGFRIIEIIKEYDPDIITFQELNHFKFMQHYLSPNGYESEFKLNTNSKLLEGVAIFYKVDYFEKVTTFIYGKDVEKGLKFDLFSISLVLKHKKSDKQMIVCSANLDVSDKTNMRMQKLMHLTASLKQISVNYNDAPIFIGCDLGSDQGQSEYFSIMFGGSFLNQNKDVPKGYEEGYGLKLQSAYYPAFYQGKAKGSEPKSTMFGGKARDFIFYDEGKGVSCSNVLVLPITKVIEEDKEYPNWKCPSAHYPLMAQFFV